jgi:glycosyltransferase involved in cell wall biosynthesis
MYLTVCVLYTANDDLIEWRKALPISKDGKKLQVVALRTEQTDKVTEPELEVVGDTELLTGLVWRYNDFDTQFDFGYLRNIADQYARGKWILHIDADERLTTHHGDLWSYLEALEKSEAPAAYVSVYGLMHGANDNGRSERYISANMRLHRKSAGLKWSGICHETLDKAAFDKRLFADTEIMLFHLGYNTNDEIQKTKAERNAKLLIREYLREKSKRNWDYLKRTFHYLHTH